MNTTTIKNWTPPTASAIERQFVTLADMLEVTDSHGIRPDQWEAVERKRYAALRQSVENLSDLALAEVLRSQGVNCKRTLQTFRDEVQLRILKATQQLITLVKS